VSKRTVVVMSHRPSFMAAVRGLKQLTSKSKRNQAIRPAVNKTATVLSKAMKRRARGVGPILYRTKNGPKTIPANQLAKSIGIRRRTYRRSGFVVAIIGPRFGYTAPGDVQPSAIAAFVEGLRPSDSLLSTPKAFARPAARESLQAMKSTFRREFIASTKKVLRGLRAKGSL